MATLAVAAAPVAVAAAAVLVPARAVGGAGAITQDITPSSAWSNDAAIAVPDVGIATPYPSSIVVSGATGVVTDVDVTLRGVAHSVTSDLDILVVAPYGASTVLLSDVTGSPDGTDVTLDDEASSTAASLPTSGAFSYRPTDLDPEGFDSYPLPAPAGTRSGTLAALDGRGPNGVWNLYVVDDLSGDAGSIAGGWSLDIETASASTAGPFGALEGSSVTLSGSTSASGAPLAWDVDGDGQFDDASGANPTVSAATLAALGLGDGPAVASVRVQATVGSVLVTSPATSLTITNAAPTATFGNNGPVELGDTAQVSFTDQADPSTADVDAGFRYAYDLDDDGDWDIGDTSYAGGSTPPTATVPTSVLSGVGTYAVVGLVLDKDGGIFAETTTITVTEPNAEPVADAGEDQTVEPRSEVALDGTGSSDPDGDDLTYLWTQIDGPLAELSDPTSPTPTFVAPAGPAEILLELLVADEGGASATDTVTITVSNQPPVADAGPDQRVDPDTVVTLDAGGSSDADGDDLTYEWVQTGGPDVVAISSTGAQTSFRAPTEAATLTFRLGVRDGGSVRGFDTVSIVVNTTPNAVAGSDQVVNGGDVVLLDGTGSNDPDGQDLTFSWTQTAGPPVTLDGPAAEPGFIAPEGPAVLTFELTVRDELGGEASDSVTVTVNAAPTADAGADAEVVERQVATLDGSGSSDPDGDDLTYSWAQDSGPTVALAGADTDTATFTVPDGDEPLVFTLTVDDGRGGTDTDTVTVTPLARLTATESFVDHTYRVLLGRESGEADRAYWVERLAGGATRTLVARQIGLSAEATRGEVLDDRYERWLGRFPSAADRDFWAPRLLAGEPIQGLEVSILASAERYAIGGTDAEYIRLLYEALLRRGPSAAEAEFWLDRLAADGRSAVARGILTSTESERVRVGDAYVEILDRPADAAGRDFWVGVLDRTGDLRRVEIGLAAAWVPSTRSAG